MIDITKIGNKTENGGLSEEGRLTPNDWNTLVRAVQENQQQNATAVKSVSLNGATPVKPDKDGLVKLFQTSGGTEYSARLTFERDTEHPIVCITDTFPMKVRYQSIATSSEGQENAQMVGTITVERSVDGGATYPDSTRKTFTLQSKNPTSEAWDEIDLAQYMVDGQQMIRFRASYQLLDDNGNAAQAPTQSAWRVFSVTKTTLALRMATDPTQPWSATDSQLRLDYQLRGEVDRTLHIKIKGSSGTLERIFSIGSGTNTNYLSTWSQILSIDSDEAGLLTHGIKELEAWLTCSDGVTADALESDHVKNQLMVVTDESDTTVRVLMQNVARKVENYVATTLCGYAVYAPKKESVGLVFRLTDYNDAVEYFRLETTATPGTQYDLPATVEIEDAVNDTLYATLRVEDKDKTSYYTDSITVDNTEKFAPTLGADFLLNPKTRNNSEHNPFTIINAMNGRTVDATFDGFGASGDLWVQNDNGQRVLRILAGQRLDISYDWLAPFATNNRANVTMEFDYMVRNVTNEDEPIITASESYGGSFIGFQMRPMEGIIYTKSKKAYQEQNFMLQEEERTHVSINIVSALQATTDENAKALALCRVFINGVINREFIFDTESRDWYEQGSHIIIGQEQADIDIYSLRIYRNALSSADVLANYTATLPTASAKLSFRKENAILNAATNLIDVTKCNQLGKNTLVWHGAEPSYKSPSDKTGWFEIKVYDEDGVLLPDYSGTFCETTKSAAISGQGTTAKTYHDWNWALKAKDISDTITIPQTRIHADIKQSGDPYEDNNEESKTYGKTLVKLYGCGLGKNDWASTDARRAAGAQPYVIEDGMVTVPDGWIDATEKKMYRGRCYKVYGAGYISKMQNKINYASAMQSHLMGANNAYNDLHTAVVGSVGIQIGNASARLNKKMLPFLYFKKETENGQTEFRGPCTFGGAKMDDATMGFDKKEYPLFCMLEGSDNNLMLTDFRTPWESRYITYDVDTKKKEVVGYKFNDNVSLDLDKFVAAKKEINGEQTECPSEAVEAKIKELVNFFYLHSPRIKVFVGNYSGTGGFLQSDSAKETTYKWWCTQGDEAYKLKRYDEVAAAWVDAGWDAETEQNTILRINDTYSAIVNANEGQWDAINKAVIKAIANDAKSKIDTIFVSKSLRFHLMFVNMFLAGTDNCSKNTYMVLVKDADGAWRWILTQDDMDTIFATDNSGYQNKPYYIDRLHPASDKKPEESLYQGDANVMFDLAQAMWEDSGENLAMMREIFDKMASLATTPWGFLSKYFFSTQRWIPAVAYNETARIRYEYPTSVNFVSARNVNPITQSCGDQLQAEEQFMKRRLVLFTSYCAWGDFGYDSTGTTGLGDTTDLLGIEGTAGKDHRIVFRGLVPHQYMYINGYVGTTHKSHGVRCKPGESYDFDMTGNSPVVGDTACALYGANYFRSLGNLGNLSTNSIRTFTINGKRLTKVEITPFTAEENPTGVSDFRSPQLVLNTPQVEEIDIHGSTFLGGNLNAKSFIRLRSIDTRDTAMGDVLLPESRLLTTVRLHGGVMNLTLTNMPLLNSLTIQDYSHLLSVTMSGTPLLDSYVIAGEIYATRPAGLTKPRFDGISWTNVSADMLMWLAGKEAVLTGQISMMQASRDRYITMAEKETLAHLYGDIDGANNALRISYQTMNIMSANIGAQITFLPAAGDYTFVITPQPVLGNNVVIEGKRLKIDWSLENGAETYANVTEDGTVHVTRLIDPQLNRRFKLYADIHKSDGTTVRAEREIGFWNRVPEEGDFAYGDGTFSDTIDNGKDVVGIVFYKEALKNDSGDTTGYRLHSVCLESNISVTTSDKRNTYTTFNWGIYPNNAGGNGYTDDELAAMNLALGMTDVCDTVLPNRGSRYLYDETGTEKSFIKGNLSTDEYNTYIDDSQPDGFKVLDPRSTLMDFDGKGNTEVIIARANLVITTVMKENPPQTLTDIADKIQATLAPFGGTDNDTNRRGCQPFYHHAYVCRLYEPQHSRTLHAAYQKGAWYEPAEGELARIYNFRRLGINASEADENALNLARTPIFANANKRAGRQVIGTGLSWRFSSTENARTSAWGVYGDGLTNGNNKCNRSNCVAVAAFDFEL